MLSREQRDAMKADPRLEDVADLCATCDELEAEVERLRGWLIKIREFVLDTNDGQAALPIIKGMIYDALEDR